MSTKSSAVQGGVAVAIGQLGRDASLCEKELHGLPAVLQRCPVKNCLLPPTRLEKKGVNVALLYSQQNTHLLENDVGISGPSFDQVAVVVEVAECELHPIVPHHSVAHLDFC